MNNRKQRALIARETLNIFNQGFYFNRCGELVSVKELLLFAKTNTIHYSSSFSEKSLSLEEYIFSRNASKTSIIVINESTLKATTELLHENRNEKVFCLNFASAKNPGGGFLNGSQAQEESIARATGLYPCIVQMNKMYDTNRRFRSCLYSDDMIYSPQVPIIRNDKDELLDQPCLASFLTAPAVNVGAVKQKANLEEIKQIESTMFRRTEKLLLIAAMHQYKVLVLGAWGCGVFKNSPHDIANYFHFHLIESKKFKGLFDKVVFAILDESSQKTVFSQFQSILG